MKKKNKPQKKAAPPVNDIDYSEADTFDIRFHFVGADVPGYVKPLQRLKRLIKYAGRVCAAKVVYFTPAVKTKG